MNLKSYRRVRHDVSEQREMKRKVGSKKGKKVGNTYNSLDSMFSIKKVMNGAGV